MDRNSKINERVLALGVCDEIANAMSKGWKTPRPAPRRGLDWTAVLGWIGVALLVASILVAAR